MKLTKVSALAVIIIMASGGCQSVRWEVYPELRIESHAGSCSGPGRNALEDLLADIWDTGFFNDNQLSREEILNNRYGIFAEGSPVYRFTSGRACYIKDKNNTDLVMLNRALFSHVDKDMRGKVGIRFKDRNMSATLVHELFHDFWHNILDRQKRVLFASEAEILYKDIVMALTIEDKLLFLEKIGYLDPEEKNFEPFERLKTVKKNYTPEKFFGTELYAVMADRTFSRKIIIPLPLRKFYAGLISDAVLSRNSL